MGGRGNSTAEGVESTNRDQRAVNIADVQRQQKKKKCHCELTMMSRRWSWKACVACACSFLVSMGGGAILVLWELNYRPSNSQQWMVPCGLILFATPVFVWIASFISDLFSFSGSGSGSASSSLPP